VPPQQSVVGGRQLQLQQPPAGAGDVAKAAAMTNEKVWAGTL